MDKKKKLLLVVLSIGFALLFLEIATRTWLYLIASDETRLEYSLHSYLSPDDQRYIRHHYLNYYPNPSYERAGTKHNSLGFRGPEIIVPKPDGVVRIVALGGSSTYTINVKNNEHTFTARLQDILREQYDYKNVEVINAGVGGYNSWESLINLAFRVLDLEPDLLIIYQGTNDVHARFVPPEHYKADNSGHRKQWESPSIPLVENSALFRVLFRKSGITSQVGIGNFVKADTDYSHNEVGDKNPLELLEKNKPVFYERNLKNMLAIADTNDIDAMLATWAYSPNFDDYASTEHYQRGFMENNNVVKKVAEDTSAPLFDFAAVMPKDPEYWSDGRHVNEKGADYKARLFADYIHENNLISNTQSPKKE